MIVRCVGTPGVGQSADGRLEVFVRGIDDEGGGRGALYHRWQQTPGGDWSNWYSHGGSFLGDPVVAQNTEGRLELFIVAEDGLLQKWQTAPNKAWSDWHFAGRPPTLPFNPSLSIARNADGRLEVFAVAWDGRGRVGVYHLWQLEPSRGWSVVTLLDLLPVSPTDPVFPVVAPSADGRLELFLIANGTVYHKWQIVANTTDAWSGWHSHGAITVVAGHPTVSPAIATNADGRLELFVVAPSGDATGASLQHIWQVTPSDGWSDRDVSAWHTEPGTFLDPHSSPTAARDNYGTLKVCAVGAAGGVNGVMWYKTQTAANNGWSDWLLLSESQSVRFDPAGTHPSLTANTDGLLALFAIGNDGALWHARQVQFIGSWSNWVPLGRPVWIGPDDFPMAWYDSAQVAPNSTPGKPRLMVNEGDNLILVQYRGQTPFSELTTYLDAVRAAGLRAMVEIAPLYIDNGQVAPTYIHGGDDGLRWYIRTLKNRPEIWAWYLYDEPNPVVLPPDHAKSTYQIIKAEDPSRLIALVFANGEPGKYRDAMDVYMVDNYPHFGAAEFDGLDGYFQTMSSFAPNAAGKRAYWPVLPGCNVWGDPRIPTLAEQRYMAYAATQAGGVGLFFWTHTATEQSWVDSVLAPVLWDFGRYARAFAHGALPDKARASEASTKATVYPDPDHHGLLLLLIHHARGAVTVDVTLDPSLQIATATVADDNDRSLTLSNNTFRDNVGPYGVNLYWLR
jgi:hypothetical protein